MENVKENPKPEEVKIPSLTCPGCIGRDRIIENLSAEIDRQRSELENLRDKQDLKLAA